MRAKSDYGLVTNRALSAKLSIRAAPVGGLINAWHETMFGTWIPV